MHATKNIDVTDLKVKAWVIGSFSFTIFPVAAVRHLFIRRTTARDAPRAPSSPFAARCDAIFVEHRLGRTEAGVVAFFAFVARRLAPGTPGVSIPVAASRSAETRLTGNAGFLRLFGVDERSFFADQI